MKCQNCGSSQVSELYPGKWVCFVCGTVFTGTPEKDATKRKKRSKRKEKTVAKALGGKRVSGSGAFLYKGDIETPSFLIEHKFTDKQSFRVTKDVLDKITVEALKERKLPALVVEVEGEEFVVMRFKDFKLIAEVANAKD